ncbi:MAG TPA: NUDIX hydrolase [Blastocatellia bacterium]|nr:NUDIX hydrolase [Blastocatellia bacterium]
MPRIRSIMEEYLKAFPEERQQLSRLSDLMEKFADDRELISRKNFIGHITASGFIISGSRVLLLHHKFLGKLLQPGGHLEPGEDSPLDGALREIQEETSLTALDYRPFHVNREIPLDIDSHRIPENVKRGEPGHWHHDFRYLFICRDEKQELIIDENESTDYRWVEIDELKNSLTFSAVAGKIRTVFRGQF